MGEKAVIEIDWEYKSVTVRQQLPDISIGKKAAAKTSISVLIAQMAGSYAYDLMKMSEQEILAEHLNFIQKIEKGDLI